MSPIGSLPNYYQPSAPINIPKTITSRFVNSTTSTDCIWFDPKMPPSNFKNEFSVILCYSEDDDDYCVCYWDGEHYLCMYDDMPFIPTYWTYLPATPKERK